MQFVSNATEITTMLTDFLLALMGLVIFLRACKGWRKNKLKAALWAIAFCFFFIGSLLSGYAHGIVLSKFWYDLIWQIAYLFLGLSLAAMMAGAMYDLRTKIRPQTYIPLIFLLGIIFFLTTLFYTNAFYIVVIYTLIIMIFNVAVYFYLSCKKQTPGAIWMFLGFLITIIASAIQPIKSLSFRLFTEFDHNSIYHLVQLFALMFFFVGIQKFSCEKNQSKNKKTQSSKKLKSRR